MSSWPARSAGSWVRSRELGSTTEQEHAGHPEQAELGRLRREADALDRQIPPRRPVGEHQPGGVNEHEHVVLHAPCEKQRGTAGEAERHRREQRSAGGLAGDQVRDAEKGVDAGRDDREGRAGDAERQPAAHRAIVAAVSFRARSHSHTATTSRARPMIAWIVCWPPNPRPKTSKWLNGTPL